MKISLSQEGRRAQQCSFNICIKFAHGSEGIWQILPNTIFNVYICEILCVEIFNQRQFINVVNFGKGRMKFFYKSCNLFLTQADSLNKQKNT